MPRHVRSPAIDRNLAWRASPGAGPTPTRHPSRAGASTTDLTAPYRSGPSRDWIKVKNRPAKGDGRRLTPVRFLGRHRRTIGRILRASRSVQSREAMNSVTIRETVRPNLMTAPAVYVSCELGAPHPPQNGSAPKALVSHRGFFSITRRNEQLAASRDAHYPGCADPGERLEKPVEAPGAPQKAQDASRPATGKGEGHRGKSHTDPVCPPFRRHR